MDKVAFGQDDIESQLARLGEAELDALDFGVIQLDSQGTILKYNRFEAALTNRDPAAVRGKNFFRDVAPCTNADYFYGVFAAGVANGNLDTGFDFTFDYMMRPTRVRVHMKQALAADAYWVLVKRV